MRFLWCQVVRVGSYDLELLLRCVAVVVAIFSRDSIMQEGSWAFGAIKVMATSKYDFRQVCGFVVKWLFGAVCTSRF